MKLLSTTKSLVLLVALLFLAACSDKPDYPASDAAVSDATISDATADVADTAGEDADDTTAGDTADTTPDTDQDTGPCNGGCGADAYCDTATDSCVACLDDTHCPGGLCADNNTCVECFEDTDCADTVSTFACDTDNNECVQCVNDDHCDEGVCGDDNACVECVADDDCSEATAAACDTTNNTCIACTDDAACSNVGDTNLCDTSDGAGVCVECTVEDETACGEFSCDPAINECTQTPTGETETCMPCKADSECVDDHRCVPMEFDGTPLADGYCLKIATTGCERPYTGLIQRESISGEPSETYCGVDESVTTCVAVLDLFGDESCTSNSDCGLSQHDDGRCESVNFVPNRCTYSCSADAQCVNGFDCASLPSGSDYCGGGA